MGVTKNPGEAVCPPAPRPCPAPSEPHSPAAEQSCKHSREAGAFTPRCGPFSGLPHCTAHPTQHAAWLWHPPCHSPRHHEKFSIPSTWAATGPAAPSRMTSGAIRLREVPPMTMSSWSAAVAAAGLLLGLRCGGAWYPGPAIKGPPERQASLAPGAPDGPQEVRWQG